MWLVRFVKAAALSGASSSSLLTGPPAGVFFPPDNVLELSCVLGRERPNALPCWTSICAIQNPHRSCASIVVLQLWRISFERSPRCVLASSLLASAQPFFSPRPAIHFPRTLKCLSSFRFSLRADSQLWPSSAGPASPAKILVSVRPYPHQGRFYPVPSRRHTPILTLGKKFNRCSKKPFCAGIVLGDAVHKI